LPDQLSTSPWISDGVHDGDGGGDVEHSPDGDVNLRDHGRQRDHNAVEQEGQDGGDDPSYKEEAVQKVKLLPRGYALQYRQRVVRSVCNDTATSFFFSTFRNACLACNNLLRHFSEEIGSTTSPSMLLVTVGLEGAW
jgi:hypothetical protein